MKNGTSSEKKKKPLPTIEQVEGERKRLRYRERYERTMRSTVTVLITAAAAAVLCAMLWFPVLRIYGNSMSPTIGSGQIAVALKSSRFEQGDVVAFYYGNKLLVKRCIAGPSQWVAMDADGTVYVDNERLDEPYLTEKAYGDVSIDFPYQVPDGKYFLMGDNRSLSLDSRSTAVGCVDEEQIIGKVIFRIWPLSVFGRLE